MKNIGFGFCKYTNFRLFFILFLANGFVGTLSLGQARAKWHTFPQPPKPTKTDPLNINLAVEIPAQPEKFQVITAESVGGAPQAYLAMEEGRVVSLVGTVKVDSPVTIGNIRPMGGVIFYEISPSLVTLKSGSPGEEGKSYWISGNFLKATGYTP